MAANSPWLFLSPQNSPCWTLPLLFLVWFVMRTRIDSPPLWTFKGHFFFFPPWRFETRSRWRFMYYYEYHLMPSPLSLRSWLNFSMLLLC